MPPRRRGRVHRGFIPGLFVTIPVVVLLGVLIDVIYDTAVERHVARRILVGDSARGGSRCVYPFSVAVAIVVVIAAAVASPGRRNIVARTDRTFPANISSDPFAANSIDT
jgi:hypothetical protein